MIRFTEFLYMKLTIYTNSGMIYAFVLVIPLLITRKRVPIFEPIR